MKAERFDTVVIGGGQAGLAMGYYLKEQGRDFIILDAGDRIGGTWSGDPERLGHYVAERLEAQAGRFWLHFDVDVFDPEAMPAVTYPLPDGLGWEHAEALLRPLVRSRRLVGLSVADFVPDKDPDGRYAHHLVDLVIGLFTPRPAKT